jgi:hypothetical protein
MGWCLPSRHYARIKERLNRCGVVSTDIAIDLPTARIGLSATITIFGRRLCVHRSLNLTLSARN